MRIGMILDNVYPPDPRVENEAIELIKKGHDVFLFCLTYGNEKEEELVKGINVRRYKTNTFEYKMSALVYTVPVYTFLMKGKISNFIHKNKIEAIHIHDIRIAEAAFKANEKNVLPVILDLHENRPEIMRFYPHMQKLRGKLLISIEKWKKKEEEFIKKATKVVVVTNEAKKEIVHRVGVDEEKIVVVPNTVRKSFYENADVPEVPYKKKEEDFTLLYLGDTGNRRGLETVLESLVVLKEKIENLTFVIVGKSNPELERQIESFRLKDCVKLMGWRDAKTFPNWVRNSDIGLSPLHRNIHHDTTFANKLFQYMSFGKPILVSDATVQKILVEEVESGLVHEERNSEDFTEKLLRMYEDEALRKKMGENGKDFVRNHFTWDKTSKDLIALYNNLA
ncbi:glycosyltransferase family 4 protein [uncultured Tenacibaculum sp.]|uniref:glycosyltransferase family 4 protein n=1 Tax=uncultured Tenacibaculum sp. TaxID=174713 RepID=UPI0026191699|nr:glycosyltransferase family 4 protein [uncultured Tenacibaculum sp.]